MEEMLVNHGLPALFLLSFLAATVLPLGSEWLTAALVLKAVDPAAAVATAAVGNYLGACTTYAIGWWGTDTVIRTVLRVGEEEINRAQRLFNRYGVWSLLFSWLPVVGDPLCLLGGMAKTRFSLFSILVFTGKLGRYAAVATVAGTVSQ